MKTKLLAILSGITLFTSTAVSAPLERSRISADAKWLIHLDVDGLRKSTFGSTLLNFALSEMKGEMGKDVPVDIPALVKSTGSITAYGMDFKTSLRGDEARGVLIWQGKEVEQVVTGLLVQQAEATKAGQGQVKTLSEGPNPIYEVMGKLFVSVRPGQGVVVSPKSELIEEACRIMEGKGGSLADKPTFSEYAPVAGGFFFVALAENFAKDAGLPAQAQVLKLAEGGRIALGEDASQLRLSVSLKTAKAEDARQIQAVLQGLVALATLAEVDEPELAKVKEWVKGTQVQSKETLVTLDMAVPVDAALKQIGSAAGVEIKVASSAKEAPPVESIPLPPATRQ